MKPVSSNAPKLLHIFAKNQNKVHAKACAKVRVIEVVFNLKMKYYFTPNGFRYKRVAIYYLALGYSRFYFSF